jgi:ribosome-binding protein aMBF1 (putative translation factor)
MKVENFRKAIRQKLFESGMSQNDLAKAIGCYQEQIAAWLGGRNVPGPKWMPILLDFLESDPIAFKIYANKKKVGRKNE